MKPFAKQKPRGRFSGPFSLSTASRRRHTNSAPITRRRVSLPAQTRTRLAAGIENQSMRCPWPARYPKQMRRHSMKRSCPMLFLSHSAWATTFCISILRKVMQRSGDLRKHWTRCVTNGC
jgi:hypothetical protein